MKTIIPSSEDDLGGEQSSPNTGNFSRFPSGKKKEEKRTIHFQIVHRKLIQ